MGGAKGKVFKSPQGNVQGHRHVHCLYCFGGILVCSGHCNKVPRLNGFKKLPFSIRAGWRRQWHPTPVLLPGKSHGQRSLVGFNPQDRNESDMTEVTWHPSMKQLHMIRPTCVFLFPFSCNFPCFTALASPWRQTTLQSTQRTSRGFGTEQLRERSPFLSS